MPPGTARHCVLQYTRYPTVLCRALVLGRRAGSCCGVLFGVVGQRRHLHLPPGGFEDELPTSFGRQNGKGELSNVNLRAKVLKWRRLRRDRKRVNPPVSNSEVSLGDVKAELKNLIERSRRLSGKSHDAQLEGIVQGAAADGSLPYWTARQLPFDVVAEVKGDEKQGILKGIGGASRLGADETLYRKAPDDSKADEETPIGARLLNTAFPIATIPMPEDSWSSKEKAMEKKYAVDPLSTVFGSDLDRLERDMMRDFHQRAATIPKPDRVFSEFGSGRRGHTMQWEPSSSFDCLRGCDFRSNKKSESTVGLYGNRNLSAYHMYAEAYRTHQSEQRRGRLHSGKPQRGCGFDLSRMDRGVSGGVSEETIIGGETSDLSAEENPHFPTEEVDDGDSYKSFGDEVIGEEEEITLRRQNPVLREVVVDARVDYKAKLAIADGEADSTSAVREDANRIVYDAYHQRPSDQRLLEVRGADFWNNYQHRRHVEEREAHRQEIVRQEVLAEGAVDTSEVEYSTNKVRKETLLYFQAHPINEMIQEPFVRVREYMPRGGGPTIYFNPTELLDVPASAGDDEQAVFETLNMNVDIPVSEARRMAQRLNLDLIRVGSLYSQKTDRRIIALCMIGDHREHLREILRFKIQKLGVQPPPTKECIEVPFKGGTHPHAIRFKSVGIAKHLLHRHAIRINLTKFGTPREGFPVFQSILDEVKRQCIQLKAYHRAGIIQSNYNEIFCYLYPSTGRSPKTTVTHPTPLEVREAQNERILTNEKEVYFDDLYNQLTRKQQLQYAIKLQNGTAWAEKDEGMSLQRQRALKVMLGYLPKGNKDMYAARGDVNIPAPFRSSHPTSVHQWSHPTESNLEQASRGAAAIGKRAAMPISEMHDYGETSENSTQLDRFYYTAQGPALEVGELKEALGLKDNRKKRPPLGPGFATVGVGNDSGTSSRGFATK